MTKRRKILFNKGSAIFWVCLGALSFVFGWYDILAFTWVASVYANIKSDWATAEAVDDREIIQQLKDIKSQLETLTAKIDSS